MMLVSSSPIAPTEGTTTADGTLVSHLDTNETVQDRATTVTVDIGTAADIRGIESSIRLRQLTIIERLDAATENETAAIVQAECDRLRQDVRRLHRQEQAALHRYANGEISAATLLSNWTRITATASAYEQLLMNLSKQSSGSNVTGELNATVTTLETMQTTVRTQLLASLRGGGSQQVRVVAGTAGYRIGLIKDGQYYSETHIPSNRALDRSNGTVAGPDAVLERFKSLYPWVGEDPYPLNIQELSVRTYTADGMYQVDAHRGYADLSLFMDGYTEAVFLEQQTLSLDRLPTSRLTNATNNGLCLTVSGTYSGGPARVQVTAANTSAPVAATVTVDGQVYRTGDDGTVWLVAPGGATTITATAENQSVRGNATW